LCAACQRRAHRESRDFDVFYACFSRHNFRPLHLFVSQSAGVSSTKIHRHIFSAVNGQRSSFIAFEIISVRVFSGNRDRNCFSSESWIVSTPKVSKACGRKCLAAASRRRKANSVESGDVSVARIAVFGRKPSLYLWSKFAPKRRAFYPRRVSRICVPRTFVKTNSPAETIERSTCDSAAS